MKKIYLTPQLAEIAAEQSLPLATSDPKIGIADGSVDADKLDVKDRGDWEIFDYDE